MRETFEREGGSMRGEEDFFSVARTMPLVALDRVSSRLCRDALVKYTFYAQRCDTLVDRIEGIFCI